MIGLWKAELGSKVGGGTHCIEPMYQYSTFFSPSKGICSRALRAFLIDLDLAIKEDREKSSGARGKTGTRAFMAIGVLLDDKLHSFMHDLESYFWVLFWICIHYHRANQERVMKRFDKWNYADTEELAEIRKGIVGDEGDFLKTVEATFTPYYQPLIPYVNRLRRKVFPDGRRWREPNPKLYSGMKEILRTARDNLKELEGQRDVSISMLMSHVCTPVEVTNYC